MTDQPNRAERRAKAAEEKNPPTPLRADWPRYVVAIGTPSSGVSHDSFQFTLMSMVDACRRQGILAVPMRCEGSDIAHNQGKIVEMARQLDGDFKAKGEKGVDAIFFFENDESFDDPALVIERLMSHDKDIVGCTYRFKHPDGRIEIMGVDVKGEKLDWLSLYHREPVSEVQALPIGALMVKLHVFEDIQTKNLPEWAKEIGRLPLFWHDIHGGLMVSRTTDYTFCTRAHQCGYKIYLDAPLSLTLTHLGPYEYRLPRPDEMSQDVAILSQLARQIGHESTKPDAAPHLRAFSACLYRQAARLAQAPMLLKPIEGEASDDPQPADVVAA